MLAVQPNNEGDLGETRALLLGDFLLYCRYFYKLLTGRDFIISQPIGRESHFVTIANCLTDCFYNPNQRLYIGVPPGYSKSTLLILWVTWTMAHYPDSKYLYISYSLDLASKHTETIRRIMQLPEYYQLFGIKICPEARGKEYFRNNFGGEVAAFGSAGGITGRDAGMPGLDRFSGALVMDDMHKPDEVHSDTLRGKVIDNYQGTVEQRPRGINVPIMGIGQRLHENDLPAFLLAGKDGRQWKRVILKALDDAGNALYPEKDPKEALLIKQKYDIYNFASQYQQDPQPEGGSLFKKEWFTTLYEDPEMICTLITVDSAESEKSWNDASAFSFWGLYQIETMGQKTQEYALHWLDCYELRVEPKELEHEFLEFWNRCQMYKTPPQFAAIEKKSTGVTLLSVLQDLRGLQIRPIERNGAANNKAERFISMQKYIAAKKITFPIYGKHNENCIKHMSKITANNTHAHDDICDTAYDAIKIGLMDKTLIRASEATQKVARATLGQTLAHQINAREKAYYGRNNQIR
jgi:predicted phage terminase large subunit-like protein